MYAALWHVLPGPWWIRVLLLLVLFALLLAALVTWVFPWVNEFVAPTDVTVDS
jgi:hypothetical protein